MSEQEPMSHPIDVTYGGWVDHKGKEQEGFMINLVQENPSYSTSGSSEVGFYFTSRSALEKFLASQGMHPIYDDEAQDVIDEGADDDED